MIFVVVVVVVNVCSSGHPSERGEKEKCTAVTAFNSGNGKHRSEETTGIEFLAESTGDRWPSGLDLDVTLVPRTRLSVLGALWSSPACFRADDV